MPQNESNTLLVIDDKSMLQVFTEENSLTPLLEEVAREVRGFIPDLSTPETRKEIASVAYKIAKTKTYIDSLGKSLTTKYKEIPKKIDASRKEAREFLDDLKEEIRDPLTQWEDQQAANKKIQDERLDRLRRLDDADGMHETALLYNEKYDREEAIKGEAVKIKRQEEDRQRLLGDAHHRKAIISAAIASLMASDCGMNHYENAKALIRLIDEGGIAHCKIIY